MDELLKVKVKVASKVETEVSQAPATISFFDSYYISRYGHEVINDLLYTQPGFAPAQDYDRPTVSFRGNFDSWSNNHILHLIDGIPFNDNLYGTAYTWLTPLFFSKNIEVIRGPGSALYGSYATNGVVQMNTLKAADLHGRVYSRWTLPGNNHQQRYEVMSGVEKEYFDFIYAYSFNKSEDYQYNSFDGSGRIATLSAPNTGRPQALKLSVNNDQQSDYFWAKATISDKWQIQFHKHGWDFQTGHGWLFWIPDFDENMVESRHILSLTYKSQNNNGTQYEYLLRYQKHDISWNQRYYPNGAFENYYPAGMWEYLKTAAEDLLFRAQITQFLDETSGLSLVAGFESDYFLYSGDKEHYSNVNVDSLNFEPFPNNEFRSLGPWLDYLFDEPVINTAIYAQLMTGDFLDEQIELTLGLRWDQVSLNYRTVTEDPIEKISKTSSQLSPRVAIVYSVLPNYSMKFLSSKAFRAPTPTEMGGAHTFSLASNITELKPEKVITSEIGGNWTINDSYNLSWNYFITEFKNQIAYSTTNFNLSTNIFSTKNSGVEFEIQGQHKKVHWFANATFTQRDKERILAFDDNDIPEFTPHPNDLKWYPKLLINTGVSIELTDGWLISTNIHYHDKVKRRANEQGNPGGELPFGVSVPLDFNLDDHRPKTLDSWVNINMKLSYEINEKIKSHLKIDNLSDSNQSLVKIGPYPFDYEQPERNLELYFTAEF
ncbi:TonB-dependent receptor [Pleionea sediminis]|uniref:TonB-dependent receptor n=1 Tax=Pleionea sediminis TaxID=2569479 RepID=UPI0013DDDDB1|nr:TonB-dependent receptor [Pleionea sediminis]